MLLLEWQVTLDYQWGCASNGNTSLSLSIYLSGSTLNPIWACSEEVLSRCGWTGTGRALASVYPGEDGSSRPLLVVFTVFVILIYLCQTLSQAPCDNTELCGHTKSLLISTSGQLTSHDFLVYPIMLYLIEFYYLCWFSLSISRFSLSISSQTLAVLIQHACEYVWVPTPISKMEINNIYVLWTLVCRRNIWL